MSYNSKWRFIYFYELPLVVIFFERASLSHTFGENGLTVFSCWGYTLHDRRKYRSPSDSRECHINFRDEYRRRITQRARAAAANDFESGVHICDIHIMRIICRV